MDRAEALARFSQSRIAHLGTVTPDSRPHAVPVTFARVGGSIVTMIDHKPKTTLNLQRLANVGHHGRATILVDYYDDDWTQLWWVRVDGLAKIHTEGDAWEAARDALAAKYEQYRMQPPKGPSIHLQIDKVTSWESTP